MLLTEFYKVVVSLDWWTAWFLPRGQIKWCYVICPSQSSFFAIRKLHATHIRNRLSNQIWFIPPWIVASQTNTFSMTTSIAHSMWAQGFLLRCSMPTFIGTTGRIYWSNPWDEMLWIVDTFALRTRRRTIELGIWNKNTEPSNQILRGSNVGKKWTSKCCTWWIKSDAFADFVACFGMAALSIRTLNRCVHARHSGHEATKWWLNCWDRPPEPFG